jgi:hypothetical protein
MSQLAVSHARNPRHRPAIALSARRRHNNVHYTQCKEEEQRVPRKRLVETEMLKLIREGNHVMSGSRHLNTKIKPFEFEMQIAGRTATVKINEVKRWDRHTRRNYRPNKLSRHAARLILIRYIVMMSGMQSECEWRGTPSDIVSAH